MCEIRGWDDDVGLEGLRGRDVLGDCERLEAGRGENGDRLGSVSEGRGDSGEAARAENGCDRGRGRGEGMQAGSVFLSRRGLVKGRSPLGVGLGTFDDWARLASCLQQ